jgi:2-haloacid dehalogenase/putative hydrolase of the HAD superfamily
VGDHGLLRNPDRLGEGDHRWFAAEAKRDGFSFDEGAFVERFFEVQAEIIRGSYELYAEVLRRATVRAANEIGWEIEPSRAQFLPDSVASWLPFRETNAAMDRLAKRYDVGIISNIDDKLLGVSRRHLRTDLDLVVTAQQVRSYKPDPAHFKEGARRIGGKKGWLHIASGYETDIAPVLKMNVPVIWVNRKGEKLNGRKPPTATVKNLREAAKRLGAG